MIGTELVRSRAHVARDRRGEHYLYS